MYKKKRKNTKHSTSSENNINIFLPDNWDPVELQHIIAKALVESEEIKRQREEQQREEELKNWHTIIGYKDYSASKWYIRWFLQFINSIWMFFKLFFIPKRKIVGDHAISSILKVLLASFFSIVQWMMNLFVVLCIALMIRQIIFPSMRFSWYINIFFITIIVFILIISRIFRMASIEVEKMEDRGYLVGILASIASIISITIAVIAVVRGG